MTTVMAPMPMPTPAIGDNPGRCDSASPKAAPMNMPGKVGPPRKPLSDTPYATPLHDDEQHERPDCPTRSLLDQRSQGVLTGEQDVRCSVVGEAVEHDG